MLRLASLKGGLNGVKQYLSTFCDEEEEDHIADVGTDEFYNDGGDIVQQVCLFSSRFPSQVYSSPVN